MIKLIPGTFCLWWLLLSAQGTRAQEDNVWVFGDRAGIDFNSKPPRAIQTSISTKEGSAVICDNKGQLLFYTDGYTVWNRDHDTMPNGMALTGPDVGNITNSCTQGTIIIPAPGKAGRYFIFSLGDMEAEEKGYFGKLLYSMVDMGLDGGRGDILPGQKGLLLDSLLTEHMMAVSGSDCNVWLVVVSRARNEFKVYNISANGIAAQPVLSPRIPGQGNTDGNAASSIDIAPNRSKLVITQESNVVLYDFDVVSGQLSRPIVLDDRGPTGSYYGACFSPKSSKVYASTSVVLNQFDLEGKDSLSMALSRTEIAYNTGVHALKRAPDGKIYTSGNGTYLNAINQPDSAGSACDFTFRSLALLPSSRSRLGLPNAATIIKERHFHSRNNDTLSCKDTLSLTARQPEGNNYLWNDGYNQKNRLVTQPGIYRVQYRVNSPCMVDHHVDTFIVYPFERKRITTLDTLYGHCQADTQLLRAKNLWGMDYTWQDGTGGIMRQVKQRGLYWVKYILDSICEDHIDSFHVRYPVSDPKVSFRADTFVCQGNSLRFINTSANSFATYSWSFGDDHISAAANPVHLYRDTGHFSVILAGKINDACSDTAMQTVVIDAPVQLAFTAQPQQICNGGSVHFTQPLHTPALSGLWWTFGDGQAMFTMQGTVQHAYDVAGTLPITMTARFRACPEITITDSIRVYPLPNVDLGTDTSLCPGRQALVVKNRFPQPEGASWQYRWNTGDTTPVLRISQSGRYELTSTSAPLACRNMASIMVNKSCYLDIPNVFTPNGDGINDFFLPRPISGQEINRFRIKIFNRQGQLLYESLDAAGQGWDGRFGGNNQPAGVYMYQIEAAIQGGNLEQYSGNITLIR